MEKAHKKGTQDFSDETYADQSRTITAEILNLEKAIKAHIKFAVENEKENPKEKRIKNLKDMIERIENFTP